MRATLIVSLLTAVVTLIFALSNTEPMEVNLLFGVVEASKAAVLIVAFLLGVAVGLLALVPSRLRKRKAETPSSPGTGATPSPPPASSGQRSGTRASAAPSSLRSTPPSEK